MLRDFLFPLESFAVMLLWLQQRRCLLKVCMFWLYISRVFCSVSSDPILNNFTRTLQLRTPKKTLCLTISCGLWYWIILQESAVLQGNDQMSRLHFVSGY